MSLGASIVKPSSNISSPYFILTQNGNQALKSGDFTYIYCKTLGHCAEDYCKKLWDNYCTKLQKR